MGEKFTAWFVTAAVIAPVCAACILGPAVIVSIFAGVAGWFGGLDALAAAGLVFIAGLSVYGLIRRRKAQRPPMPASGELSDER
jgi:membrane protein implicated in regulation of membrane protease activity